MVTKLKTSNCDKSVKTQIVTKLKNSYCKSSQTQMKTILNTQYSILNTQIMTKVKYSKCDKTKKF